MPPILPFYYLCHINPQKIMELLRYFYHPDHTSTWLSTGLGISASTELSNLWITDNTGRPIQHLHYLPFGEDWVDQRNSSWNAPYTFSGKEKDVETGYGYFGARYYDSGLSICLSVDPMSDKYPSMSPYNYCANNPVILVDPDGREIDQACKTEWNNQRKAIEIRKAELGRFAYLNKISGGKFFQEETNQYKSISNILQTMDDMEISDQKYSLERRTTSTGETYLRTDNTIVLSYSNTSLFVHEVAHCGQFENKEIGFMKGMRGGFNDVFDEIDAYTAQAAYNPRSLPQNSHAQLSIPWLLDLQNSEGKYSYREHGKVSYNGEADASKLNLAYPDPNPANQFNFKGQLQNQPGAYFKK